MTIIAEYAQNKQKLNIKIIFSNWKGSQLTTYFDQN